MTYASNPPIPSSFTDSIYMATFRWRPLIWKYIKSPNKLFFCFYHIARYYHLPYLFELAPWALIQFFAILGNRLFEVGANSRLGAN